MPRFLPAALLVVAALFACAESRALTWSVSTVDSTRDSGHSLSMRLNGAGVPRLAYWSRGRGIRLIGRGWKPEMLAGPDAGPAGAPGPVRDPEGVREEVSLALDRTDRPWLAYARIDCAQARCSGPLRLSRLEGGTWRTEDVGRTRSRAAIEVGNDGSVHLCYSADPRGLVYAVRDSAGRWTRQTVVDINCDAELRLDASGRPHLAWGQGTELRHAVREGGRWRIDVADSLASVGSLSLVMSPSGQARIAYQVGRGDAPGLWYAEQRDGGWNREIVLTGAGAGLMPSLAFGPLGDPMIAFSEPAGGRLMVASRERKGWVFGGVDREGHVGDWVSLAIDGSGRPVVAWQADVDRGTRLALGVLPSRPVRAPAPQPRRR